MTRGYQDNFSTLHADAMYDRDRRERKAKTMIAVLEDFFSKPLSSLSTLDVGASTGVIDNYLSQFLGRVVGIDIDKEAIAYATSAFSRPNLTFRTGDAMQIPFDNETFDVVICAQIYEHVPNANQLLDEIWRVLRPGGICYFAAGNRLNPIEPHYHLPFLSVIPRPLAHVYLRLAGKGNYYYEKHLSYWGLKRLVQKFAATDYTKRIIEDPHAFSAEYMLPSSSRKAKLARLFARHAYWALPGYVWILTRPAGD